MKNFNKVLLSIILIFLFTELAVTESSKEPSLVPLKAELSEFSASWNQNIKFYFQQENWEPKARVLEAASKDICAKYNRFFNVDGLKSLKIILIERKLFEEQMSMPAWINTFYHKGRIFVPVSADPNVVPKNLYRALKHEFTHAYTDQITSGKTPVWLDEGLASRLEGDLHPAYQGYLAETLRNKNALALDNLTEGFATKRSKDAKIAYAYSHLAVEKMGLRFGNDKLIELLKTLGDQDSTFEQAWFINFHVPLTAFQTQLDKDLVAWSKIHRKKSRLE